MPRTPGSKNKKVVGIRINARVNAQVAEWLKSTGNITGTIEKLVEAEYDDSLWSEPPQWVSVSERMPPKRESTQYLVMRDNGPYKLHNDVAVCDLVCRWWTMHGEIFDVTHWMPLPEPPK